ncbi:MnhB domain-containing protein [Streptomyces reniochalinae]|uniref:Sodium:proton antiporter n=1 Tax=Streptomyces reniochalinae TaxID=2250578 RepID=A0A367EX91_9ACTN|nr:MnhB domain-containing protein [Streptomyces reniochalinae]RCG22262.1 sodium:proton antiporter [Streptomyces reniochalinae]
MSLRVRMVVLAVGLLGLAAMLVAAFRKLPGFGGSWHPYGQRAVETALGRHTSNVIASINFDQRAFDTMGEQAILFGAVLGTVVILRTTRDERRVEPEPARVPAPLRRYALAVLPVTLLTGLYVVAHGQVSPGGGFQGGVVAATALHLLYIAVDYRALQRVRSVPLFTLADAAGEAGYPLLGLGVLMTGASFLENVLPYGTLGTLSSGGTVPVLNAAIGLEVAAAVVVLLAQFLDQAIVIESEDGEQGAGSVGDGDGRRGEGGAA